MKHRFISGVIATLLATTVAWAATNLNSSKSNIFRLTYPSDLVSPDQAKAILAELDKMGPTDEAPKAVAASQLQALWQRGRPGQEAGRPAS